MNTIELSQRTYAHYDAMLQGRNHARRRLENHTWLVRDGEAIHIKLHTTNIITYEPGGRIILSSGGYRTSTTKERLNKYAPVFIEQAKGLWTVYYYPGYMVCRQSLFYDGITIKDGRIIKPMREDKKTQRILKLISRYCDKLRKLDKLPEPSTGDCWYCCLYTADTHRPLGDVSGSDHLITHLKDQYVHGSLIVNAFRDVGYSDRQIGYVYHTDLRERVVQIVRRYFKSKLGLAR